MCKKKETNAGGMFRTFVAAASRAFVPVVAEQTEHNNFMFCPFVGIVEKKTWFSGQQRYPCLDWGTQGNPIKCISDGFHICYANMLRNGFHNFTHATQICCAMAKKSARIDGTHSYK